MSGNAQATTEFQADAWKIAITCFCLLLLAMFGIYRETAWSIVKIWLRSDTFAHGFLVVPITLWLVWRVRERLAALVPQPNRWAVFAIFLCGFGWLLGDLATVGVVTQYALTTMIVLLVPAILGLHVARQIAFPLLFLYFAVPFGEFALPQLMDWTAKFTVIALRLTGIPVYQEGLQFVIPSGNWSVVEACSGVRYIIASLTVGTLFAYLNYRSLKRRIVFIGVSFVVPIIANWLRAYAIVMIGHFSGNTLAVGVDHLIYGGVFFGVVILLMFVIGTRWAEDDVESPHRDVEASITNGGTAGIKAFWISAAAVLIILLFPPSAEWLIRATANPSEPMLVKLPLAERWRESDHLMSPGWKPAFANPSAEQQLQYTSGDDLVGLYVGYYRRQDYEKKLISSENVLVRSKDPMWARVSSGKKAVTFSGKTVSAVQAELRAGSAQAELQRLAVTQIYWVNGVLTGNDFVAKLMTAFMQLTGRGDDSAVIILYSPKANGENAVQRFIDDNAETLLRQLEQVRNAR